MPEISRFFGIIISMFFDDHNPPHFHARYNEYKAVIAIDDLRLLEGSLPPRVHGLVVEWALKHKDELMRDWNLTKEEKYPEKIEPLL
ncbi:MAG TPA: DUF4160 domain-containing protein [Spirochaetota bacterium]|nr:DUF4160 domain-containing protein [Spirochaetota bacterium]